MNPINQIETLKVLNLLKGTYPYIERDRSDEQLEQMFAVYLELLEDVDPTLLKVAAMQVMTESRFFPTIAELREKVLSIKEIATDTPDHSQAWSELMSEVGRVGYMAWADTEFSTLLIREVAKIYWHDACLGDMDNLPTVRAQFRDTYNARVKRQLDQARMLPSTVKAIKALAERFDISKRLLAGGDRE